jgi:hypothetical protein
VAKAPRKARKKGSAAFDIEARERHWGALGSAPSGRGWLYHATLGFRVPEIRERGLDPEEGSGMADPESGYAEHSRGGLFLSDAAGVGYWLSMIYGGAWVWAEKGVKVGRPELLRVRARECPVDEHGSKDASVYLGRKTKSYRCVTAIPPEEIEIYDTAAMEWRPLVTVTNPTNDGLGAVKARLLRY